MIRRCCCWMSRTPGWTRTPARCWTRCLRQVAARGRTVVMTSHDLTRVEDLASRFDVLTRGSIQASIRKEDLPRDGLLAFYRRSLDAAKFVQEAAG